MTILYCTLRDHPGPIVDMLRHHPQVEAVVLLHDRSRDALTAFLELEGETALSQVLLEEVTIDTDDLLEAIRVIQRHVHSRQEGHAVFDVTHGPRVVVAAAMFASVLEGCPAYYSLGDGRPIALPLIASRYERMLSEAQRRVLHYIIEHEGSTQVQLRRALGLSKPTVSHHIRQLVGLGLVREARDPIDARRKILRSIASADLIIAPKPAPQRRRATS